MYPAGQLNLPTTIPQNGRQIDLQRMTKLFPICTVKTLSIIQLVCGALAPLVQVHNAIYNLKHIQGYKVYMSIK